jgi:hypothetical protein
MSLAADVAIAAAERIERSAGANAGLAVFKRLASNAGGVELRARAILGGMRCAVVLRDLTAIRDLSQLWQTVDSGAWDGIYAICKDLWRVGLGVCATDLAHSEVRRMTSARALYAYARCLDVAGDTRAGAAFGDAIVQAEKEGAPALLRTARVRRALWLSRSAETLPAAIEEAKRIVPAEVTPEERLVVARVLLRSPSRFVRAGALGILDELATARTSTPKLVARALLLAARHADETAGGVTALETDRLVALFGREPFAKSTAAARDAVRALERMARSKERQGPEGDAELERALDDAARSIPELGALHRRAREILAGRFEAHHASALEPVRAESTAAESTSPYAAWGSMLDAVVAMRDNAWARAARALRHLAERAERGERMPAQAWTITQAALGCDDTEVRGVAGRLVAAMTKTTSAAPPRGWLALATSLAACGMDELATHPRRAGALAKEPGAEEALALALTRSAWQLALSGERSRAIARLREAKAIAAARSSAGDRAAAPRGSETPGSGATPST